MTTGIRQNTAERRAWEDIADGDVLAWSRHITGQDANDPNLHDDFESITFISGDANSHNEDVGYVVVQRTINDVNQRYIEMFQPLNWYADEDMNDAHFVDCADVGRKIFYGPVEAVEAVEAVEGTESDYPELIGILEDDVNDLVTNIEANIDVNDPQGTTEIANEAALLAISNLAGSYYLSDDITMSGTLTDCIIGASTNTEFTGIFDGRGYKITYTYDDGGQRPAADDSNAVGLFYKIGAGALVQNLIVDVDITGNSSGTYQFDINLEWRSGVFSTSEPVSLVNNNS